jgi:hypothetical protein
MIGMRKLFAFVLLLVAVCAPASAQTLKVSPEDLSDEAALDRVMPELAKQALAIYQEPDRARRLSVLFRTQVVAR